MTTLAPSFFVGSSLFLQVTRTTIISRMGSKFSKIGPGTYELAALERLEKSPDLLLLSWEKCCDHSNTFIFGWIFSLADNKTNHESSDRFEFGQDSITDFGVSSP